MLEYALLVSKFIQIYERKYVCHFKIICCGMSKCWMQVGIFFPQMLGCINKISTWYGRKGMHANLLLLKNTLNLPMARVGLVLCHIPPFIKKTCGQGHKFTWFQICVSYELSNVDQSPFVATISYHSLEETTSLCVDSRTPIHICL